jgi:triacylglycerol lipase
MSLTKLPAELYRPDAFKQFSGGTEFQIGNARAMAWMSQLAYETDEPEKIGKILQSFGLALVEGGVLAALIAHRIGTELPAGVDTVYTFGMPRPGSNAYADLYNQQSGMRTYWLVHGEDIVPTVAPTSLGFMHLGRVLHCERQGRFDQANLASDTSSDFPPFAGGVAKDLRDHLHGPLAAVLSIAARIKLAAALLTGMGPSNMRTDPAGILIEMLPPRLRDHMPDRYIGACNG